MLTKEIIKDSRLSPLFDENSIDLLQLFILETINKTISAKEYKIVYGWCIKSTREASENKLFCGDPSEVYSSNEVSYSIYRVSFYNTPKHIVSFINKLVEYKSLKAVCTELEIDSSKLIFDVNYIPDVKDKSAFKLRPLIFNETNTLISRNFYEKYSLNSPYKNVPSVSLIIYNLNKIGLLQSSSSEFYPEWKQALLSVLEYLKAETTLPFESSGVGRFGNIEFINSQCSNEFEVHNVWFENAKEKVVIDHKEVSSSKKVTVTLLPNTYTCNKKLVVNCFLGNGGQVILDDCKETFHEPDKQIEVEFECKEPISQITVSVWVEENGSYHIWYKHSVPLLRTMHTNMGMVSTTGVIKSEWLSIIENSNNKTKSLVKEAEKISKASYSNMVIGDYDLDPWVSADRDFAELITQLYPPKSEAQFFARGWNTSTEEHGAISFLEWFKKITEHAQKVVIQDPFYDTLGLEFLARTTNADTSFTILTCTQVKSDDDDTNPSVAEPNRAMRIKKFINDYPSTLNTVKLDICDLRSNGGGGKNLLHDRYMFVFEKNVLVKGFHLSNSIQAATVNYPLLITPIPADVLNKVNQHILDTIKDAEIGTTVKMVQLVEKKDPSNKSQSDKEVPADAAFLEELKSIIPSKESVTPENIALIINKLTSCNEQEFFIAWSTIGYFLAHNHFAEEAVSEFQKQFTPVLIRRLASFMQSILTQEYPIGYSSKEAYFRNSYHTCFEDNFEKSLENSLWYENYVGDLGGYGNWGAHYGSKLLIVACYEEYIKLVQFLNGEFTKSKTKDISKSPLLKLNTTVFNRLVEKLFWFRDLSMIEKSLKSNVTCLKALSVAGLISNTVRREPKIEAKTAIELIINSLSVDDALSGLCKMLMELKKRNHEIDPEMETEIFEAIHLLLLNNYSEDRVNNICAYLNDSGYPLIEQKVTNNILLKLNGDKKLEDNFIFELWSKKFLAIFDKFETYGDYAGILDLTGWSLCTVDKEKRDAFITLLEKKAKSAMAEVRKPFKKESNSWDEAFNRLFLIQGLMGITIMYNERNISKIEETVRINSLIGQIKLLKTQFDPTLFLSKIKLFANQIMEELEKSSVI